MAKLKKKTQTSRKSTAAALKYSAASMQPSASQQNQQMASLVAAALAANPANLYLNPLLVNNPLVTAALLQQQQQLGMTAAAAATQARSRKSRSVSNDSASSFNRGVAPISTASPTALTPMSLGSPSAQPTPALGLKLVLKRQSGDKYEVKPSSSSESTTGRPKREASRRVKFVFNEYETDSDYSPDKKRNKLSWSSSMPAAVSPLVSPFNQILPPAPFRSFSSGLDVNSAQLKQLQKTLASLQSEQDEDVFEDEEEEEDDEPPAPMPFHPSEIIRRDFSAKVEIVLHQPKVMLRTSRPFQIVLVESKSNIICTKALLYIHLFQSYTAQCIACLTCGDYLTIGEFSKHLHKSEDDDDDDFAERLKQTFKVLPYRGKDKLELNQDDLETWKLFGIRYARFKQEHLARLKQQKEEEAQRQKLRSVSSEERPDQFKNWDQVSEDRTMYMIDKSKLIYNEVVCPPTADKPTQRRAAKRARTDRLSDQEDSDTDSGMETDLNEASTRLTPPANKSSLVDDLSLSEDESEAKETQSMSRADTVILSAEEQTVVPDSAKTMSIASSSSVPKRRLPSRHEKYINFYDNMSQANLMYICDNEFTIIPDSYVDYINSKRESNQRNIKLAETSHFQKIWLSMSLDLELECRRVPSSRSATTRADSLHCSSFSSPATNRSVLSIFSSNSSTATPPCIVEDKEPAVAKGLETIEELTTDV